MIQVSPDLAKDAALVSELAAATYRVAERHGFQAAFIDIELDLWHARSTRIEPFPSGEELEHPLRSEVPSPLQCWIG